MNQRGNYRLLLWLMLATATVPGCSKKEPKQHEKVFGDLIEGPATTASDRAFQVAIGSAETSSALSLLKRLNEFYNLPRIEPKGDFVTSAEYEKRSKLESKMKSYGRKCFAHVSGGDFLYDADSETAAFFHARKRGFSCKTRYHSQS